jgi:hypothetical protein
MNAAFNTALAAYGSGLITHIGLKNGATEISGGSPAYARISLASVGGWSGAAGVRSPAGDMTFNVPAGAVVDNWSAYTASSGGTEYGGATVPTKTYSNQGTYKLLAASTNITVA